MTSIKIRKALLTNLIFSAIFLSFFFINFTNGDSKDNLVSEILKNKKQDPFFIITDDGETKIEQSKPKFQQINLHSNKLENNNEKPTKNQKRKTEQNSSKQTKSK
jgi:hypothetical protein